MFETVGGGILTFIMGTVLGSFVNVVVIRLREASSILGRSRCMQCERTLKPRHLIPIVSWFILKGRCAFCRAPIHRQYPLVEFIAGLLVLVAFLRHPIFFQAEAIPFSLEVIFLLLLLTLSVFDLRFRLLPLEIIGVPLVLFFVWELVFEPNLFFPSLLGALVAAVFLGLQVVLSRGRWMGSGDPWLGALIGAVLGWPGIIISLYITYLVGGLVALFLLLVGRVKRGNHVPFAPLLALGALLTLWFGKEIETWLATWMGWGF